MLSLNEGNRYWISSNAKVLSVADRLRSLTYLRTQLIHAVNEERIFKLARFWFIFLGLVKELGIVKMVGHIDFFEFEGVGLWTWIFELCCSAANLPPMPASADLAVALPPRTQLDEQLLSQIAATNSFTLNSP